jgi:hypothetical protein
MRKKDRVFRETYRIDESTNRYMIEIALDRYTDIFNKWDSAPFRRREIDLDLGHYLETCSDDIPFRYSVELDITIPKKIRAEQIEEESRSGIENHFTFKLYLLRKELNKNNSRMLCFALIGFFLLGIATIYPDNPNRVFPSVFDQALLIGGWVFLWEAFSLLFFTNRELYDRYRTYKRLKNAPIIFREKENRDQV